MERLERESFAKTTMYFGIRTERMSVERKERGWRWSALLPYVPGGFYALMKALFSGLQTFRRYFRRQNEASADGKKKRRTGQGEIKNLKLGRKIRGAGNQELETGKLENQESKTKNPKARTRRRKGKLRETTKGR